MTCETCRQFYNAATESGTCPHRRVSRMDVRDLAMVRRIILTVLDDGDPARAKFARSLRGWHFDHDPCDGVTGFTEADATEQRLRFCDAIQAAIMKEIGPDEAQLRQIMAETESLQPMEVER